MTIKIDGAEARGEGGEGKVKGQTSPTRTHSVEMPSLKCVSFNDFMKFPKDVFGIPTFIAFDEFGHCYIFPRPSSDMNDAKVLSERERCARVAEGYLWEPSPEKMETEAAIKIAAAIRSGK